MNKIDLKVARPEVVTKQIEKMFDFKREEILRVSGCVDKHTCDHGWGQFMLINSNSASIQILLIQFQIFSDLKKNHNSSRNCSLTIPDFPVPFDMCASQIVESQTLFDIVYT